MDWLEKLNKVVEYVEEHITEELDMNNIAKISQTSSFDFLRMFSNVAGISLSDYIRCRRISLSVEDILAGEKIIDVAFKYGYSNPTSFTRAFKDMYGIAPSALKNNPIYLKPYQPMTFVNIIKGVQQVEHRIVEKEAFRIIGYTGQPDIEAIKNFPLWTKLNEEGIFTKLLELNDQEPQGRMELSHANIDLENEKVDYFYCIGVASDAPLNTAAFPPGLTEFTVPASTWAVFKAGGKGTTPFTIGEEASKAIGDWLPTSGYSSIVESSFILYTNTDDNNSEGEIWIAVKKEA